MNIFERDLGLHQGRIALSGAPDGAFIYELGHALMPDVSANVGDFHEIQQSFVKDDASKFIQVALIITTPPVLPVGVAWRVSASLNNQRLVERQLRPSKRKITLDDWRISLVTALAAPDTNTLAFRLELV